MASTTPRRSARVIQYPPPMAMYCPRCMMVDERTPDRPECGHCIVQMVRLMDERGALSREYLIARKVCCKNACRNCPYGFGDGF